MPSFSQLSALLLLPAAISAVTFDCKHIRAGGKDFNFEKLGGPKEVNYQRLTSPSITNTTFTIDVCKPLTKSKGKDKAKEECPTGTRVCGVERIYEDGQTLVREVIPIAGEFGTSDSRHLDPKVTRLKDSESNSDSEREGLRAELHGGLWEKKPQKAIIEFICDPEMEGTEGFEDSKEMDVSSYGSMEKRDDEEGDGDDEDDNRKLPDLDGDKALQWKSYRDEKDDTGVLRLEWKTKYACEDAADTKPSDGKKGGSWGFFTWFLIIVFLLAASYIIFGSWLNYNRYGARGWDLLPHGDTIRDLPYIVKDIISSMMDKLKGGGSRGGYSAV
ncbi:hypothetical protein M409DRAFT_70100 [Zasmidium cellare ATCC 36951]|uniref:Autophagy-related protein 27 n=1 Tax=Zasmidium cellare ATCC 36951 TaxID=1080233 RepID=A0A6A6C1U9_ZASCE|nr:uncharacterized protein M409DRAFT_70100 [Zasmidium cellare ATCC 36951]KAF2161034.1 hypothetical protein M409DRAFT_70100 [Zasmidium cellare ATCC 36951]